jgi:hypothetical protein
LKPLIFLLFNFCLSTFLQGQRIQGENYGATIGLNLTLGTTVNRIGIVAKGYYIQKDFQFNLDGRYHFNMSSYGPKLSGQEWTIKSGVVWAWGEQQNIENPFLSPVSNQIGKINSLGYSFNYYWDEIGTNQTTGIIGIQLNRFNFTMENDAFAPPPADKFRTAAMKLTYRLDESTYLLLNSTLWTGDPFTDMIDTQTDLPHYPSRYGYRDMTYAKYGNYSHGILGLGLEQMLPYGQEIRCDVGIDSEWVRYVLQNIIIHDLYFVPDVLNPAKFPHIPILADDGQQYLFYSHQRVKPACFFAQLALNGTLFY